MADTTIAAPPDNPAPAAAAPWPRDQQAELEAFYGAHVVGPDGRPTATWEKSHLTVFPAPYPMVAAWDHSARISRIRCHQKVAPSLQRVLQGILAHFGSEAAVQRNRMHLWGGCYNYRPVRFGNRLSVHAWGAAIDLDPDRNPLGAPYTEGVGMIPMEVVGLFEAEGWKWGGRFSSRPDCMHFQAAV